MSDDLEVIQLEQYLALETGSRIRCVDELFAATAGSRRDGPWCQRPTIAGSLDERG